MRTILTFAFLALAAGCAKEAPKMDCRARCAQQHDKFVAECKDGKTICEAAVKNGDDNCAKMCDIVEQKYGNK